MVLDNDVFSWRRAAGWAVLAWLALGLAALIAARLPGDTGWLLAAAPLLVIFLAGIYECGFWWIYGSLVTLVPMILLMGGTLASLLVGKSPGSEMGRHPARRGAARDWRQRGGVGRRILTRGLDRQEDGSPAAFRFLTCISPPGAIATVPGAPARAHSGTVSLSGVAPSCSCPNSCAR